jgi:Na+/H+ antiporter NhaD/arsenite permease-like protein
LQSAGILQDLAQYLNDHIPSIELIAGTIGLASALIDNVPLVAATMGMYSTEQFPMDSEIWQLIAFCAGTGGSILIIGSAAGVAYMGMEKADFLWYLKKVGISILPDFSFGLHYTLNLVLICEFENST